MSILISITKKEMKKIETRRAWPVAMLARVIRCHPSSLYRMLARGILHSEDRPARITTESIRSAQKRAFFYAGWVTVRVSGDLAELNFTIRIRTEKDEITVRAGERELREVLISMGYALDALVYEPGPGLSFLGRVSSLDSKARSEVWVRMW